MKLTVKHLVKYLDQTNLKPEATEEEIREFIEKSKEFEFYGVAVMPLWVPLAREILKGSETRLVVAIGYPLGTIPTELKVQEVKWAVENGPSNLEIDMVMNLALLKSGNYDGVREDINAVVKAADGRIVKVIIEAPLLKREEVVIASMLSELGGAHFVKTSTGYKGLYGWRPTTVEDVKLIKSVVGERLKIKAAGGINTLDQVLALIEAGASRIGTSSGVHIVETLKKRME